jgi:hypothetical protein
MLLFYSCDKVEYEMFRSYITDYYDYNKLDLEINDVGNIVIVGVDQKALCGYKSKGKEKELFDSLCIIHNDMNYNQKIGFIAAPGWGYQFKGDLISIDVVSNKNFDEQHPANSSLNDVVRFLSISLNRYIMSDYTRTFDWNNDIPENFRNDVFISGNRKEYHPIDVKIAESSPSDFVLADLARKIAGGKGWAIGVLSFDRQPTLSKEHKLTVTVRMSDGRVFTPTITKVFE